VNDQAALLRLVNVSKSFQAVDGGPAATVLHDINLDVPTGTTLAIMGPSGSGKSTLLNLIGALDRPTEGEILFDGTNLATLNDTQLAAFRNRQIGFVFQQHHLLPQCTALENVLTPTLIGEKDSTAEQRAMELLKRVGLGDHLAHRPGQLSGGQRQRVAVVRSLINQPKLLLADEPTGALDTANSDELAELLCQLNSEHGVTVILVTHERDLSQHMQQTMHLVDGRLQAGV